MMTPQTTKLVIVTEKILLKEVSHIIEAAGVEGYLVMATAARGSRSIRSSAQPGISDTHTNIKFEVITSTPELAKQISDEVAAKYFSNYVGIAYREPVEVLHAHNF